MAGSGVRKVFIFAFNYYIIIVDESKGRGRYPKERSNE